MTVPKRSDDALVIEQRPATDPDVISMVAEVQAEYVSMYGGPDVDVPAEEVSPPAGVLLVGTLEGRAVATGGWRRLPTGEAEVKRMYVRPAFRRRGLAARMLDEIERTARTAGVERMVLNTGPRQPAAIELYRTRGYRPVPPFGHYADVIGALFYGRSIAAGDRSG